MAWTAHKNEESMREVVDEEAMVVQHAERIAQIIKESRHFVAFTGAGISTSAGIPDFRGPQGVWTLRAQGKAPVYGVASTKAAPTRGHMALVALQQAGYLKFLISQNTDGLHRRSGFPPDKLAELHGNTNLETCVKCRKQYLRDFSCRARNVDVHDHRTERKCICGSQLNDSIINFGESLPEKALRDGFENAKQADLMLVLGSSLTVTPAADMPRLVGQRGKRLVICNLQKTPLDSLATVRSHARTDDLLMKIAEKLNVPVPEWHLQRRVVVSFQRKAGKPGFDDWRMNVSGIEPDGTPASIFSAVELQIPAANFHQKKATEPFDFAFTTASSDVAIPGAITLHFMGHYNEPPLVLSSTIDWTGVNQNPQAFRLLFNPRTGEWQIEKGHVTK